MSRTAKRSAGRKVAQEKPASRIDLYDEVTQRIIAELEAGRPPWAQPLGKDASTCPALPRNALTGRAYSGINVLILWGAVIEHGWPSQSWLTFRQAIEAGGCVRKGERGQCVVYADRFIPDGERQRADRIGEEARAVPFLKRFTVFNVAQCDGLADGFGADPVWPPACEIVPLAEQVIAASGVTLRIGGDCAFYAPEPDFVQVPPQPAFFDQINFYRTVLHELTHATGHSSRLDRKLTNAFASKDYAREELVAEIGSAFLCAALGIVSTVRHADYIGAWLEVLREDNRAIFRAASAASRAAEWLLARHREATDPSQAGPGGEDRGMILLPQDIRETLQANGRARRDADRKSMSSPDPVPVLKLFNPLGPATWLATELGADGDTLFGLADLGFGCRELGTFSLSEIGAIRLPFGLGIERDTAFATSHRLSLWAAWTRRTGSLMRTETLLRHTLSDAEVRGLDLDRPPG